MPLKVGSKINWERGNILQPGDIRLGFYNSKGVRVCQANIFGPVF